MTFFEEATRKAVIPEQPARRFEPALERALGRLLRNQSAEIAELLAQHKGTLPKAYWDKLEEQLYVIIEPWLERVTRAGMTSGNQQLEQPETKAALVGIAWDLVNQDAQRQARAYTYNLVRGITDNTRQRLQAEIDAWIASGNAFPALSERLRPLIPDLEKVAATALQPDYRARLTAATEATRAYADGNTRVWEAAGVWGREWRTAVDERVCPICGGLHQQRAKLGADFEVIVDGKRVVVKNPPAHPNCRCSVFPVVRPERSPSPGTGQVRRTVAGRERTLNTEMVGGVRTLMPVDLDRTQQVIDRQLLDEMMQLRQRLPETYGARGKR